MLKDDNHRKIDTYKRFRGDDDGLSRSSRTYPEFEENEWYLIGELLSALHIIRIGMASSTFARATEQKLLMHVADERSSKELRKLSERGFD
jgi:hypothetical protein